MFYILAGDRRKCWRRKRPSWAVPTSRKKKII